MKHPISMFAVAISAAAGCAYAQTNTLSYTDVAPYTDIRVTPSARGGGGAPPTWKGQLSRADVVAAMRQARSEGTIAVGDALNYPAYPMKVEPPAAQAGPSAAGQVMGGPPDDGVTSDGYKFVGGEAGWIYVGRPRPAR